MKQLKEDRSYYLVVLLTFIPFGFIYGLWFQYDAIRSLNTACGCKERGDSSKSSPGFILFLIFNFFTLGIYEIYWTWKQGKRMTDVGNSYGISGEYQDPERKAFTYIVASYIMMALSPILSVIIPALGFILTAGCSVASLIMRAVNYNKFYSDLNVLCKAYNRGGGSEPYVDSPVYEPPVYEPEKIPVKPNDGIAGESREGIGWQDERMIPADINDHIDKKGGLLLSGQYGGSVIDLRDGDSIVVGRDPARCALVFESERISRVHLSILYKSGNYYVTDMSTNGTVSSRSGKLPKNQEVIECPGTSLWLGKSDETIDLL